MPALGRWQEHISGGGGESTSPPLQSPQHSVLALTDCETLKYKILIYDCKTLKYNILIMSMPATWSCHPGYLFLVFLTHESFCFKIM